MTRKFLWARTSESRGWAHTFLALQPFASILDTPLRIYVGDLVGTAALLALGVQLFWIAALIALGRAGLAYALDRLEVHGG